MTVLERLLPGRGVPRVAAYTWKRQWRAELGAGVVDGSVGLATFTALRLFGAEWWVAAFITSFGQLFWLASPAWEALFARLHHRTAFVWMGLFANLPMLLVAFCVPGGRASLGIFIAVVALLSAIDTAYIPQRAALLRANYPESVRGRIFARLSSISRLTSGGVAVVGGQLLHRDPNWLRVIYPVAGVCGLLEHWTLSRIHWQRAGRPAHRDWSGLATAAAAMRDAWGETFRILRKDARFRTFEVGFMLYGFGLMMSSAMIAVFAEDELHLGFDEWGLALGVAFQLTYIVTILRAGRIVDRAGVMRTTAAAFGLLAVFFLVLPLVSDATQFGASYVLYGVSMALVNLGWTLGPLEFAPPGKARSYATVHLLCVGMRTAVGPLLGWQLAKAAGFTTCFLVSAVFVAFGCVTMLDLSRRSPRVTAGSAG